MTPFGDRMRKLRAERGVTLKDMADAIGVSSAYLSALEHGKRGRPGWHLIQRIIAYFNIIWDEAEEVVRLARISHPRITIDTAGLSPQARPNCPTDSPTISANSMQPRSMKFLACSTGAGSPENLEDELRQIGIRARLPTCVST